MAWTQTSLISLVSITHRYIFEDGLLFAIGKLETSEFLPSASQRLILARRHGIKHWIKPAVSDLVRGPFTAIPDELCDALGGQTLKMIALAHAAIERARKGLTCFTPAVIHASSCSDNKPCIRGFAFCWTRLAVMIHNNIEPAERLAEIFQKLEGGSIPGMDIVHPACARATLESIRGHWTAAEETAATWIDHISSIVTPV